MLISGSLGLGANVVLVDVIVVVVIVVAVVVVVVAVVGAVVVVGLLFATDHITLSCVQ